MVGSVDDEVDLRPWLSLPAAPRAHVSRDDRDAERAPNLVEYKKKRIFDIIQIGNTEDVPSRMFDWFIVAVIILNILSRKGKVGKTRSVTEARPDVDFFQSRDEIPISDSIDKLSIQLAMVLLVYLATFLAAWGLTSGISALSEGLANTLNALIWGFNFIIGSALAVLTRVLLEKGKKAGIMTRQYQNNYLLNRISGFFFDIMICAGIASINIEDLSGLWVPFLLLAVAGGIATWLHLAFVCRAVYKDYYYEGLISMFGMMTGTISSGVLLLREIDPDLATPAAGNLVTGSTFGILLGEGPLGIDLTGLHVL